MRLSFRGNVSVTHVSL